MLIVAATISLSALAGCQGGLGGMSQAGMSQAGVPSEGPFARMSRSIKSALSPSTSVARKKSSPLPSQPVTERNYSEVQIALGQSLERSGKLEGAEAAYEAALRNNPKNGRAHHRLALIHEKTGRGEGAYTHFRKALQLDPNNAELHCDYGYFCYLRRNWQEAEGHLERAVELDRKLARAHNNLALVLARSDRAEGALAHFAAAGLAPAEAYTNLGFVHMTEQRLPQAKRHLEQAIETDPACEKAQDALARLERVEKLAQASPPVTDHAHHAPSRPEAGQVASATDLLLGGSRSATDRAGDPVPSRATRQPSADIWLAEYSSSVTEPPPSRADVQPEPRESERPSSSPRQRMAAAFHRAAPSEATSPVPMSPADDTTSWSEQDEPPIVFGK